MKFATHKLDPKVKSKNIIVDDVLHSKLNIFRNLWDLQQSLVRGSGDLSLWEAIFDFCTVVKVVHANTS